MAERDEQTGRFLVGNRASIGRGPGAGNQNGWQHGTSKRSLRKPRGAGKLPADCNWIASRVNELCRALTDQTLEAHGDIRTPRDSYIETACTHEMNAMLAQRRLRLQGESMGHAEYFQCLNIIGSERDKRDKAIEKLRLDTDPQTILQGLYGPILPPDTKAGDE